MKTDIKNTILESYQVRKGKKKKTAFINYIEDLCKENNISCTVEKKGISRNIVMGAAPEECEMIVGGHYDTCARMLVPNFITPRNGLMFILYQFVLTLLIMLPGVLISAAAVYLTDRITPDLHISAPVGLFSFGITTMLLCALMMIGPANKHTANDNTSGVVTVLNTMLTMSPEQRAKVCFVLFDNEELGMFGSSAFTRMHKSAKKDIPMVNLDCVSDGDYLFARLPSCHKKHEFFSRFSAAMERSASQHGMNPKIAAKGIYPSDQMQFKQGIGVACLNRSKLVGMYMNRIHTKRDTVFNDRNIDCLTEGLIELVSEETA